MKNTKNKWFTLIELMITITIMVIMWTVIYVPYQHYQTKQKVRNSAKIISQTLYESRNLAINWINTSSWNLAIWLSFSWGNDYIELYSYPNREEESFSSNSDYINYNNTNNNLIKKINLEPYVEITNTDKYLFIFDSINWKWNYYKDTLPNTIIDDNINLEIWFKWTTSWNLTKKINYYTKTYITDIE